MVNIVMREYGKWFAKLMAIGVLAVLASGCSEQEEPAEAEEVAVTAEQSMEKDQELDELRNDLDEKEDRDQGQHPCPRI